jgi:hypothetical protein
MSEVRWEGETGGGEGGNAESLAPCARALAFEMERIGRKQFWMRDLDKPMVANDMINLRCVPYRLRRHGAYYLAGRVAASFYLDSLLTFSSKEKVRRSNRRAMKSLCLLGKKS